MVCHASALVLFDGGSSAASFCVFLLFPSFGCPTLFFRLYAVLRCCFSFVMALFGIIDIYCLFVFYSTDSQWIRILFFVRFLFVCAKNVTDQPSRLIFRILVRLIPARFGRKGSWVCCCLLLLQWFCIVLPRVCGNTSDRRFPLLVV